MRPKVVAGMLLLAGVLLGAFFLMSKALRSPSGPAPTDAARNAAVGPAESSGQKEATVRVDPPPSVGSVNGTNALATDPAHERYVRQRTAELEALAMKSDTASRD